MNEVININIYLKMPRVTAEELEDENIMKNDTDIKL
jgi:hypothetical protein